MPRAEPLLCSAYVAHVLLQAGGDAQLVLNGVQERRGGSVDKSQ
jgi:hypothetical protein